MEKKLTNKELEKLYSLLVRLEKEASTDFYKNQIENILAWLYNCIK
jgi:hypothetical protein